MHPKQLLWLVLLMLSSTGQSQFYKRSHLDSLKSIQAKQEGIEQINTLLHLGETYRKFQLDSAQLFLNLARKKSKQLDYKWGICKSYFIESNIQFSQGIKNANEVKSIKKNAPTGLKEITTKKMH